AAFLGSPAMNFVEAELERRGSEWIAAAGQDAAIPLDARAFGSAIQAKRRVIVGVRPHDVALADDGLVVDVALVEALGTESFAHGTVAGKPFVARLDSGAPVRKGETIRIAVRSVHLFDAKTGASLRVS